MPKPLPRLKKRSDFLATAASKTKRGTHSLVLQIRPHTEDELSANMPPIRVGFTATRKIGNAVIRNRTKRRLRALADTMLPASALSGYDYVLIGRHATVECPYAHLQRDLLYALRKLGVAA